MTTTMTAPLIDVASLVRLNNKVAVARTAGFTEADWKHQIRDSSSAMWIIGHLCIYRGRQLRMLDVAAPEQSWEVHFAKETRPGEIPADVRGETVLAEFTRLGEQLASALEKVTPEHAARSTGTKLFNGAETIGATATTWLWHESYHVGQLGLIRKALGKQ